jgi:TetR/AcrR family transcriptional repressor of nem operon
MAKRPNTSEEILRCARSLIVAGGYNGFSYADIAKVVGVRNASIHHYFPSKADLVHAVVAGYREDVEAGIAEMERRIADPVEQLRAYTAYWETCIADASDPFCVCALLASEIPALPDEVALEVRAHFRRLSAWLASVLERGASQGSLRLSGTPREEAEAFMAGVHGAMLSARAYADAQVFGIVARRLLERLVV